MTMETKDEDEHVLKDGERRRIPMMMRDSADSWRHDMHQHFQQHDQPKFLVTDGTNDPLALHRPGFRYSTDAAARIMGDVARAEAYEEVEERDANAWRRDDLSIYQTNRMAGTLVRGGDNPVCRSNKRDAIPLQDAREDAYQQYDEDAANAGAKGDRAMTRSRRRPITTHDPADAAGAAPVARDGPAEPLEQRIPAALGDNSISSDALSRLIADTQSAIVAAEQSVEAERKRALDPSRSPNPIAARQTMEDAEFRLQWLKAALPKLHERHQQVAHQETYDEWLAMFEGVKSKHAAAAARLKAIYCEFGPKLVEALLEAEEVDADVRRVMDQKPILLAQANGDGKSLPTVECAARSLKSIAPGCSLMRDMKLPLFEAPNVLAWPPPETPLALQVAIPIIPGPGADWHKALAARDAERQSEAARMASYHKARAEEREQREAAEARAEREQRRQREAS